jgi:hypothetical protein
MDFASRICEFLKITCLNVFGKGNGGRFPDIVDGSGKKLVK